MDQRSRRGLSRSNARLTSILCRRPGLPSKDSNTPAAHPFTAQHHFRILADALRRLWKLYIWYTHPTTKYYSLLLTSITVYFLPIWFQSIKGSSAVESGIHLLPMMISMVVGSIGGGITNSKIGYYTPLAIIGSCIMSVGAGLLTTFQVDTSEGKWIGYQIVYGIGLGLCFQVPNLAAQTVLPKPDVPSGLGLMLFGQMIGAAVFVSVGENILANQLVKRLSGLPGFNPHLVTSGGVTELLDTMPADLHDTVLHSYNDALQKVFQVGMIISCLTVLGAATLEWKSISKEQPKPDAENKGQGGEKSV